MWWLGGVSKNSLLELNLLLVLLCLQLIVLDGHKLLHVSLLVLHHQSTGLLFEVGLLLESHLVKLHNLSSGLVIQNKLLLHDLLIDLQPILELHLLSLLGKRLLLLDALRRDHMLALF